MPHMTLGTNEKLLVSTDIDADGELQISMPVFGVDANNAEVDTWLTAEDAEKLIAHLQHMFEL